MPVISHSTSRYVITLIKASRRDRQTAGWIIYGIVREGSIKSVLARSTSTGNLVAFRDGLVHMLDQQSAFEALTIVMNESCSKSDLGRTQIHAPYAVEASDEEFKAFVSD